jgi:hypothetical protein
MRGLIVLSIFVGLLAPGSAVAAESLSGLWRIPGQKPYSELRTIDHGNGDVEFQFDLWGGPPAYNSGGMEGHLSMKEGRATFETTKYEGVCRIDFEFAPKQVTVRQTAGSWAECGFGHNIVADGRFVRISKKVPKFVRR